MDNILIYEVDLSTTTYIWVMQKQSLGLFSWTNDISVTSGNMIYYWHTMLNQIIVFYYSVKGYNLGQQTSFSDLVMLSEFLSKYKVSLPQTTHLSTTCKSARFDSIMYYFKP